MHKLKAFIKENKLIVASVVFFMLLTTSLFYPLFFKNKILATPDIRNYNIITKEINEHRIKYNEETLWTNSIFGGMPTYQVSPNYAGNLLKQLDRCFKLHLPPPADSYFLLGIGFFIFLLLLELKPKYALIGGLLFALNTPIIIAVASGHYSKLGALAYLPPLIGSIIYQYKHRSWFGFLLVMLFSAMEFNANHLQITYYGFMFIGIISLAFLIQNIKQKTLSVFTTTLATIVIAIAISIVPNVGNLLCTNDYSQYSMRNGSQLTIDKDFKTPLKQNSGVDKEYATRWSNGISEIFNFIIPNYKGGESGSLVLKQPNALKKIKSSQKKIVATQNAYFGNQPYTGGPNYMGCVLVFLFVLSLFIVHHPLKKYLIAIIFMAILLSWGKNLAFINDLFYNYFPLYNKFRSMSMILLLVSISMTVLAILCVKQLTELTSINDNIAFRFKNKSISLKRALIVALSLTAGFCLISAIFPSLFNDFYTSKEMEQYLLAMDEKASIGSEASKQAETIFQDLGVVRQNIVSADAWRSFIYIMISAIIIFFSYRVQFIKTYFLFIIGGILIIDVYTIDLRYLNTQKFQDKNTYSSSYNEPQQIDNEILKDTTLYYRVVDIASNTFENSNVAAYHKTIGGYHPAKLSLYSDLIEYHLKRELNLFSAELKKPNASDSSIKLLLPKMPVTNLLNTKYIILPVGDNQKALFENSKAKGNAWFVSKIKKVATANEEITALKNIDINKEAIINTTQYPTIKSNYDTVNNTIKLTTYRANNLKYEANCNGNSFAVFSEMYYAKGWNAYIDGKLTEHVKTNYALRGLEIPKGNHQIEFKFEPTLYKTVYTYGLIGSLLFYGIIISIFLKYYFDYRKRTKVLKI